MKLNNLKKVDKTTIEEHLVDPRIKPVSKGGFRYSLSIEDIVVSDPSFESWTITNDYGRSEMVVLAISDPVKITYVDMFSKSISSITDGRIAGLVEDLMYFNQGIDDRGIRKMVEYIVRNVIYKGEGNIPVISYEDLYPKVAAYCKAEHSYDIIADKIIFFEKDSMLTTEQKRAMAVSARSTRHSILKGEIIHNAALTAINIGDYRLQITKPRILGQVDKNKIRTVRTLNKHIREDTEKLISKHNRERIFKTEKSLEKFKAFLELPDGLTFREAAFELNVSLSTISEFNKQKENNQQ